MKKLRIAILIGALILSQTAARAGQLSAALEQYRAQANAGLAAAQDETVRNYVQTCLIAADRLIGLEAGDPRVLDAFDEIVKIRLDAAGGLTSQTSGDPAVRNETAAYNKYLQPYRKDEYIGLIRLQDQLFERKYFKTEISGSANFIEGYINGRLGFTRADHGDVIKVLNEPTLGVSPWEMVFRLEPALVLNHSQQTAIFGTAGLSFTFFPDINRAKTPVSFEESFWSKYIQKSGIRLGIGACPIDNSLRLLLGAGVQINILGLWAIYEPDNRDRMIGVGVNNLSILTKIIPWFE